MSEQWQALRSVGGGAPARKSANSTAGLESPELFSTIVISFLLVQLSGFPSALGSPVQQTPQPTVFDASNLLRGS